MRPGARVAAAISVLDEIEGGVPAEKALTGWARRSRFAGSGDRAAVRDHVYQVLRCRRSCACLGGGEDGRALMIGLLRAAGEDPQAFFTGQGHAPPPLSAAEHDAGAPPVTDGDRMDLPDWLIEPFRASLGNDAQAQAEALRGRAPVMLRVNRRSGNARHARTALAEEGILTDAHPVAETALKVTSGARRLANSRAYREGLVELQDGSGQAAMEIVGVPSGARVLDYCAGGGGKTLALGARLDADFFAHDANPRRLADIPARAARAGLNVKVLAQHELSAHGPYDAVICDVPCSGSGTWRRTPEAKWRLSAEGLARLLVTQDDILDAAWRLLAPGGVLVYATCSLLEDENEARVGAFLQRTPGTRHVLQRRWPVSGGGDGFFVALVQDNLAVTQP